MGHIAQSSSRHLEGLRKENVPLHLLTDIKLDWGF
jgi:hypothetical protein